MDERGECILQEGVFWSTGGQYSLMGYYILITISSQRHIRQVLMSYDSSTEYYLQLFGSFNMLDS